MTVENVVNSQLQNLQRLGPLGKEVYNILSVDEEVDSLFNTFINLNSSELNEMGKDSPVILYILDRYKQLSKIIETLALEIQNCNSEIIKSAIIMADLKKSLLKVADLATI